MYPTAKVKTKPYGFVAICTQGNNAVPGHMGHTTRPCKGAHRVVAPRVANLKLIVDSMGFGCHLELPFSLGGLSHARLGQL